MACYKTLSWSGCSGKRALQMTLFGHSYIGGNGLVQEHYSSSPERDGWTHFIIERNPYDTGYLFHSAAYPNLYLNIYYSWGQRAKMTPDYISGSTYPQKKDNLFS